MKIKYTVICLFAVLSYASCKRESPTSWNTDLYAPLAKGRITLADIVPDSLLQADENSLWHLVISENLTNFNLDSIVKIPDTVITKKFTVPVVGGPFTLPNGTSIINQHDNNLLNVNDAQLRLVKMKSGRLEYSIKSYINGYLSCTYNIPGVTLNGTGTVIQATTEPKQGNQPYTHSGEINLAGYEMDLTGQSGFMTNRVYTHLSIISAVNSPTQAQVYGQDSVVVELKFVDPVIEYAKGYFGQYLYSLNQTVDITNGFNMPAGTLNIDEATMSLNITNAVGIDAQIHFQTISGINQQSGNTVNLNYAPLLQPINITRAHDSYGNVQTTHNNFSLNNNNSNLDVFIENLPDNLLLQADININPLGNITDGNDFIYTANTLKAVLNMDVPLNVGMENITFADTLAINSDIEINADGKLMLYIKNAFPFSASCDVSLIDENNQTTNVLLQNGFIGNAIETGVTGVTTPVESIIAIPVTPDVLRNINTQHRIVLRIRLNTPTDNEHYGLYKNYYMDFKIIADGKLEVSYE